MKGNLQLPQLGAAVEGLGGGDGDGEGDGDGDGDGVGGGDGEGGPEGQDPTAVHCPSFPH